MTSLAPEPVAPPPSLLPSARRVWAFALRHFYLYRESWPRLVEMMYWPMINIMAFGFVSLSIVHRFGRVDVMTNAYLAGLLLAETMTRTVMAVLVMYMEEVWSRNLGHLFASPVRLRDYVASLFALSAVRCLIAVTPACILVFFLFHFSIVSLGGWLPLYVALLCLNGWWFGLLIVSLLLRFGLAAEWMGWMLASVLLPFTAPFYPLGILPLFIQHIARCLPATYVFESMKGQVATGAADPGALWTALGLNAVYLVLAIVILARSFRASRISGGLLQMGE